MTRFYKLVFCLVLALLVSEIQPAAQTAAKKAKATPAPAKPAAKSGLFQDPYIGAIAIDAATGKVLLEDKADAKAYPASVLKLMDMLILMEKIEQKQLSLQDSVTVSARAAKTGGSQVYLAEKEVFTVDELIYALMVQSANDAAVALAEKGAGTTEAWVELMNQHARQLGMNSTSIHSVHGLPPGKGQLPDVTTARDFSILCRELVLKHPEILRYTSTRLREFRPSKPFIMRTHNHLLASVSGCDGLKTGYYPQAGFSIAVTAAQDNRRVIIVMLGSSTLKVRDAKAKEWVAKAFAALPAAPVPAPQPVRTAQPVLPAKPVAK